MNENKSTWLTTGALRDALDGHRDNDIKVEIRGVLVPLSEIYYLRAGDTWVLVPYDGDDLATALAPDIAE